MQLRNTIFLSTSIYSKKKKKILERKDSLLEKVVLHNKEIFREEDIEFGLLPKSNRYVIRRRRRIKIKQTKKVKFGFDQGNLDVWKLGSNLN